MDPLYAPPLYITVSSNKEVLVIIIKKGIDSKLA
jgi:hypothetical protein